MIPQRTAGICLLTGGKNINKYQDTIVGGGINPVKYSLVSNKWERFGINGGSDKNEAETVSKQRTY